MRASAKRSNTRSPQPAPVNRLHPSAQACYQYDAWGNVVQIDHTAGPHKGEQVRLSYDDEHRLLVSERLYTDRQDHPSSTENLNFSGFRLSGLNKINHLGGPWSRYTYASDEPGSKVVAHSTEGGLGYQFDYQPQETIVTDNLGRTTRYGFDGEGDRKRLARQTNALGHTTQFVYNLYGHLVQHIDPLGRVSQYSRDAQGQLSESTPPQGKPTKVERGPGGQVQSITCPGGAHTQLQHDRFDRLTQVTDPLGRHTHYRYPDPAKEPSGNSP